MPVAAWEMRMQLDSAVSNLKIQNVNLKRRHTGDMENI
jgi:hypothetical protein